MWEDSNGDRVTTQLQSVTTAHSRAMIVQCHWPAFLLFYPVQLMISGYLRSSIAP